MIIEFNIHLSYEWKVNALVVRTRDDVNMSYTNDRSTLTSVGTLANFEPVWLRYLQI